VVRVPLGPALQVVGYGPFSIANNHLSSGGTAVARARRSLALTVSIMNLGMAIELDPPGITYSSLFANASTSDLGVADNALASSSSGAVLFTNNICQLETRTDEVRGYASVGILTLDHLIFANNHCWVDGPFSAITDIFLLAISLQACGNRLQEAAVSKDGVGAVLVSGLAAAVINITTQNFSTYCLFAVGAPTLTVKSQNLVIDRTLCPKSKRTVNEL